MWLGSHQGGSLNLGLFTLADHPAGIDQSRGEMAEWAAGRASKEFLHFYRPHESGRGLREALEHLKTKKYIPADVLPPRVRAVDGGYVARVKKGGRRRAAAAFPDPWDAYAAMCELLKREFPKQVKARAQKVERAEGRRKLVTLADFMTAG